MCFSHSILTATAWGRLGWHYHLSLTDGETEVQGHLSKIGSLLRAASLLSFGFWFFSPMCTVLKSTFIKKCFSLSILKIYGCIELTCLLKMLSCRMTLAFFFFLQQLWDKRGFLVNAMLIAVIHWVASIVWAAFYGFNPHHNSAK